MTFPGAMWDPRFNRYVWGGAPMGPMMVSGGILDQIPAAGAEYDTGAADVILSGAEYDPGTGALYESAGADYDTGATPVYAGAAYESGAADVILSGADAMNAMSMLNAAASGAVPYVDTGAELVDTGARTPRGGRVLARVRRGRGAPPRRNMPVIAQRGMQAVAPVAVAQVAPPARSLKERKSPLGFFGAAFGVGETRPLIERPQLTNWQGYQLVIPASLAPDFLIVGIFVEQRNVFANGQPQDAQTFIDTKDQPNIDMPVNRNGLDVTMTVTNISGVAGKVFRGTIRGNVVTDSPIY